MNFDAYAGGVAIVKMKGNPKNAQRNTKLFSHTCHFVLTSGGRTVGIVIEPRPWSLINNINVQGLTQTPW
jgi:hypothetical protein